MYKALYISPMIPSYKPSETSDFFVGLLGFKLVFKQNNYHILQKDHLTIHIMPAGEETGEMEFYFEIDQVDALWAEIHSAIKERNINHREPFDQPYRMREFHIQVPESKTLLFVGQEIRTTE